MSLHCGTDTCWGPTHYFVTPRCANAPVTSTPDLLTNELLGSYIVTLLISAQTIHDMAYTIGTFLYSLHLYRAPPPPRQLSKDTRVMAARLAVIDSILERCMPDERQFRKTIRRDMSLAVTANLPVLDSTTIPMPQSSPRGNCSRHTA